MIEILSRPTTAIRLAAIDFDGTMSLIRIGWQHVMHGVMKHALHAYVPHPDTIDAEIVGYIARSTGQPSIIQMAWVDEQVIMHGGPARGAQYYLDQFSGAMRAQIDRQVASIHDDASADQQMVPGARAFLQLLHDQRIHIALVSGTEHHHYALTTSSMLVSTDQVGMIQASPKVMPLQGYASAIKYQLVPCCPWVTDQWRFTQARR
jgi:hypothetical protein